MFKKKIKQNFRVIAVIEDLNDVSNMLKDYFMEYGYKSGIVTKLEVNTPYEIAILHIDPNYLTELKKWEIECLVVNVKNALVYKKEILKLSKKVTKTGSIVSDKKIIEKLQKNLPKTIMTASIDMTAPDTNKSISDYKYIGFFAHSITKSFYKFTDDTKDPDKVWKITNKYAYRMEALLFATVNSCGLIS